MTDQHSLQLPDKVIPINCSVAIPNVSASFQTGLVIYINYTQGYPFQPSWLVSFNIPDSEAR